MHSSSNKLEVINFNSDISPTILSSSISDTSTTITVSNAGILTSFEGSAIGVANTGYLLIDNEIISYNSISGNDITIAGRAIDNSLKTTHAQQVVY